jgi:hypothetical protein
MSDFTITKEQLRSLTDPKVKGMFPGAFENVLEDGKWYKSDLLWPTIFCANTNYKGNDFTGYGVKSDDSFVHNLEFGSYLDWQPATQEEVFDALKRSAIKMGYKKGLYCVFGKDKHIRAIQEDGFRHSSWAINALVIGDDCIFQNGEWAEIVNKNLL